MSVKFLLLFLLVSLTLSPLGKQTIARLKTNNTQVFVYIIYENTRSPRLLRADLARTLRIQTRALWKDCLDLLLTDALRGNPRRFGSFFWDAFSVLSLTAFPFFHSGILPKRQGGNLLGNDKLLPRSSFLCDRSSGVCKKEEVLWRASVWWKSQ